eukprot:1929800-Pyramimonas_sp.AAC.1
MARYLQESLGLPLAVGKFGMTATSGTLLRQAQVRLGPLGGGADYAAPHLGIDFTGGKPRRGNKVLRTRAKRFVKYFKRRRRLSSFQENVKPEVDVSD